MALMLLCGFWHMLWTIVHFRIRKVGAQKKSYRAGGDTVKKSDGEQKQEGKAGKRGVEDELGGADARVNTQL